MDAKKVAEEKLEEQKDEEVFASVLTLINDETQDIEEALITKFRSKEDQEEETGLTNFSQVKAILEEINKETKEKIGTEPFNPIELAQITKFLTEKYGYK